jgi:hypothetical protein
MEERFYRLYLLSLNRALESVSPTSVNENVARELLRQIVQNWARYTQAAELDTKRQILAVIRASIRGHKDALAAAIEAAGVNVSASFVGVSREAFENLFLRRNMGLTASYKSLSVEQAKRGGRAIERSLQAMVLDGESWQRATQRIVDGLTQGDPELRKMASAMARRSRGLGNWLQYATDEADLEAIKQARKIAYDARRIARTEPAHAFHEADRTMSERSPIIKGMQWNLSPRHPEPDICDVYAKHDFHGMGPGVYPPEYLPPLPHPHDLCFMTHVLREPGAWQRPKEQVSAPAKVRVSDIRGYMTTEKKTPTPRALATTVQQINRTSKKLTELSE